ncbi:hypothetical protein O9929_17120 [Vibrio lentus]|nr:hypothetical protein [Vibrio lentus]
MRKGELWQKCAGVAERESSQVLNVQAVVDELQAELLSVEVAMTEFKVALLNKVESLRCNYSTLRQAIALETENTLAC